MNQMGYLDSIIQAKLHIQDLDQRSLESQEAVLLTINAINEKEQLRHDRNQMIARVQGEQASYVKEMSKEYMRSMLLSSPGDLLRKVAVKRLVDNGGGSMGLGGFLSLDEKAKKDATDYSPSLNHRAQDMNDQLRKLGPRDSIGGSITQTTRDNAQRHALRGQYHLNLGQPSSQISVSAQTQADIVTLGVNAGTTAVALSGMRLGLESVTSALREMRRTAHGVHLNAATGGF